MRKVFFLAAMAAVVAALGLLPAGETSATHQAGLVAYWPFDESGGTTAFDAAHDNHGAITDATHECADMAPVTGNACSLDFNGTTAVVEAANESNFDLTALSISFWFKLEGEASTNDYPRPVSKGNSTTTDGGYSIWVKDVSAPTDIGMGLADTGGTRHDARDSALTNYHDSGWHHVVGTYDSAGPVAKLYVDGTLEATNTDAFTLGDVDNPFSIGAPVGTGANPVASRFFNGLIDEVCVWNRDLSTSEIAAYASGVPCDLLFDDQAAFEAATGAAPLSIPAAADVGPPIAGLDHTGCAESISIPFGANNVTVTAPNAHWHSSLPTSIQHPICVIEPGVLLPLSNTNPHPEGPTMVANGEDDYLLVFDVPVNAVGFELLTNSPAVETVTLKDAEDNVIASLSVDGLTWPNMFEFVGFSSPTPIKSVFVDTTNGAVQNEGISAIKAPHRVDIDIKPGSDPNCINPESNGVIPVAILGSATFDASTVNPITVVLEGGLVRLKGKSGNAGALEDVNGDGYPDLVVHIMDISLSGGSTEATLTGNLFDGTPITGTDFICIVPPES